MRTQSTLLFMGEHLFIAVLAQLPLLINGWARFRYDGLYEVEKVRSML